MPRYCRPAKNTKPHLPDTQPAGQAGLLDRMGGLLRRVQRHSTAASPILLAILLTFSLRYMLVSLSRSWFFSSDEYVLAGEVIRFLNLDLHQQFFDMPGTPFMMLSAVLWALFYPLQTWFSPDPASLGIIAFTYHHLDWFFALLRSTTIFFYAGSLVLLFLLAGRLLNRAGAFLACLLMMMSSTYAYYSSFCRVESMAIFLDLSALLVTYRALAKHPNRLGGRPSWGDPMILAGFLVGVSAAVRLHSIAAAMPLLFLILLFDERVRRRDQYPRWTRSAAIYLLPSMFAAGSLCYWWAKSRVAADFPHAAALLTKTGIAMAAAPVAALLLYHIKRTRPVLLRALSPEAIKIGIGCLSGLLLANFTAIPQYRFFLSSMDLYSGSYIDWQRTAWPLWTNIRWYIGFYLKVFAPDTVLMVLLLASVIWIVISRNRRLLPYLLAFVVFFVSKPLNLRALPHHTLPWLPYFAILCAFPMAQIYSILASRSAIHPKWRMVAPAAAVVMFAAIAVQLTNGPRYAADSAVHSQERLQRISQATDWIKLYTPVKTSVALSYFCFNPDVFYMWLQGMDVPIPASEFDGRRYLIWWGRRDALKGIAGYACGTGGGKANSANVDKLAIADPDQVVDLYHDPAFRHVASFGNDLNEVDLFSFDFRAPDAKTH
jgi:4-amino-4-deoxy-L-arabinose transferase-like glycosyltransferase